MSSESISPQEELYHIQESTNDDGSVNVEILGWEKDGGVVNVEFRMPTIETRSEQMVWPDKDTDDYKFVRLVRQCGYDLAGAEQISGEYVAYDGEIVAPQQQTKADYMKSLFEPLAEYTTSFAWGWSLLFWPVVSVHAFLAYDTSGVYNQRSLAGPEFFISNFLWWYVVALLAWGVSAIMA